MSSVHADFVDEAAHGGLSHWIGAIGQGISELSAQVGQLSLGWQREGLLINGIRNRVPPPDEAALPFLKAT